jgi:hypothetical protein
MAVGPSSGSPNSSGAPSFRGFKSPPSFHSRKSSSSPARNLPIKGSISNRCSADLVAENKLVDSKIREYNHLLITKSYIFCEMQARPAPKLRRLSSNQICNFEKP